jgi:hypothetical protein
LRCDLQNLGNFMTDRNSSRVLAPPGGQSSICFGNADPEPRQSHGVRSRPLLLRHSALARDAHARIPARAARL